MQRIWQELRRVPWHTWLLIFAGLVGLYLTWRVFRNSQGGNNSVATNPNWAGLGANQTAQGDLLLGNLQAVQQLLAQALAQPPAASSSSSKSSGGSSSSSKSSSGSSSTTAAGVAAFTSGAPTGVAAAAHPTGITASHAPHVVALAPMKPVPTTDARSGYGGSPLSPLSPYAPVPTTDARSGYGGSPLSPYAPVPTTDARSGYGVGWPFGPAPSGRGTQR